jgi:hypothetical protein
MTKKEEQALFIFERKIFRKSFLWRQNDPEANYSPIRISGGECFQRKYHAAAKEIGTFC